MCHLIYYKVRMDSNPARGWGHERTRWLMTTHRVIAVIGRQRQYSTVCPSRFQLGHSERCLSQVAASAVGAPLPLSVRTRSRESSYWMRRRIALTDKFGRSLAEKKDEWMFLNWWPSALVRKINYFEVLEVDGPDIGDTARVKMEACIPDVVYVVGHSRVGLRKRPLQPFREAQAGSLERQLEIPFFPIRSVDVKRKIRRPGRTNQT